MIEAELLPRLESWAGSGRDAATRQTAASAWQLPLAAMARAWNEELVLQRYEVAL